MPIVPSNIYFCIYDITKYVFAYEVLQNIFVRMQYYDVYIGKYRFHERIEERSEVLYPHKCNTILDIIHTLKQIKFITIRTYSYTKASKLILHICNTILDFFIHISKHISSVQYVTKLHYFKQFRYTYERKVALAFFFIARSRRNINKSPLP